jgi:hypothetical protein
METADGEVTRIIIKHFTTGSRRGRDVKGEYICPEVLFNYSRDGGASQSYTTAPQALAFREYKPSDKMSVIFPKGHPETAVLYSFGEFWLPPPYAIFLSVITMFWTIGFIVVVFKPWRNM